MSRYERQIRTTLEDLEFLGKGNKDRLRGLTSGEKDFGTLLGYLEQVFGSYEDNMADGEGKTKDFVFGEKSRRRAREQRGGDPTNAKGQKVPLTTECQSEEGLPPSIREGRLKGYVRYRFFPMDRKDKKSKESAKRKAEVQADDLSEEAEGQLLIQVRETYCKDIRQWGYGVWVKTTKDFERKSTGMMDTRQAPSRGRQKTRRLKSEGEFKGNFASSGEVREWTAYRGASRKNVDCPKCYAPKGFPCVSFEKADVVIYKPDMSEDEVDMMEVRRFRTNEHRERVDAYLPSIGLMIVKRGRTNFIVPIEEVEVGEKTEDVQSDAEAYAELMDEIDERPETSMDRNDPMIAREPMTQNQQIQWLLSRVDDKAIEEFEEAEDEGKFSSRADEIAFLEERLNQEDIEKFNELKGE